MNDDRPNPDALLAQVRQHEARQQRGKLKVFFGMAPGVGKTYAMLEEARNRAAEGADVLIGYAEPHIRPETESLLLGMEILPYKIVEYRGTRLKEFDLDAALARKPSIVCVDELAHTNAPGMRHPKRWQDVAELLDAGIAVYTTLNVQHLESYNDIVERITSIRVQETLPDAVLEQADEVELVDIAPEELLERFQAGKVYSAEQAERASTNFFKKGNLIALRELALRRTADRVDAQIQDFRRQERVARVIPASERVLVCVSPSPLSSRLVRSARRLAAGLRAQLIAVYVETSKSARLDDAARQRVQANLRLAEELGAQTVTLDAQNVVDELLAYATSHNVTKIVVGKPVRSRWRDVLFGSVVEDLVRRSGDIDIYVIRGEGAVSESKGSDAQQPLPRSDWTGWMRAIAIVLATSVIGWPLYHSERFGTANVNVLMLYLLGVLWVATHYSRAAAVLASILSVAAFDFLFVEPELTFAVSDRQYVVTFAVMLLTALVISELTHRVRVQVVKARQRERRTAALLEIARDLSSAGTISEIVSATQRHVADAAAEPAVVVMARKGGRLQIEPGSAVTELDEKEMVVAQWVLEHDQPAGRGTNTLPAAIGTYVPLRTPRGAAGVIGILHASATTPWAGERRSMVEALAAQAALAIERASLADEARHAWERAESEFLRNVLLSGVSHDLRTPLAAITGAATSLIETGDRLSAESRTELLETIHAQSLRMERLVNNLLEMTRLESGNVQLKRNWQHLQEVVGAAVRHLEPRLAGRRVEISIPAELPLVHIDDAAVEEILVNLLDNAINYAPPEPLVTIRAWADGDQVTVEVADRGPGVPAGTEKRIFEKFFRAESSKQTGRHGVGLGLAICKGLVEAHGGQITAANRDGGGAVFQFTLPRLQPAPQLSPLEAVSP